MKPLDQLSKDELLGLIWNELGNISMQEMCECATCGLKSRATLYYVCDKCNEIDTGLDPVEKKD